MILATARVGTAFQMESVDVQPSRSNFFILTQNWFAEACEYTYGTSDTCAHPPPSQKHLFIVRDLCMHGPGSEVYKLCGGEPLRIESLPITTQFFLSEFWPEALGGTSWQEAWRYCGTCTGRSQSDYFGMALNMHQTMENIYLNQFLSLSTGLYVDTKQLLEACGGENSAVLSCRDNSMLAGIYTCWSTNSTNSTSIRIDCPQALQSMQSCGSKVFIPNFQSKQSEFAIDIRIIQYTCLLFFFIKSWRNDRRGHKRWSMLSKRSLIKMLAIIHAGAGAISKLWETAWQTGDELGLSLRSWLRLIELVTNPAISMLMLYWYTRVCAGLVRAKPRTVYIEFRFCSAFLLALAGLLAGLYLFNVQVTDPERVKQTISSPIPLISLSFYVMNMCLEMLCLRVVFKMLDGLWGDARFRPSIKFVFCINLIEAHASAALVIVHIPAVQEFLSSNLMQDWYSWTICTLFFVRYLTLAVLIEPVTTCEKADALHFGPSLSYDFTRGRALVVCNSDYRNSLGGLPSLDFRDSPYQYKAALEHIGFSLTVRFDLDSESILGGLEEEVMIAGWQKADGIAFVFMGHGGMDFIFGVDGIEVSIAKIKSRCLTSEVLWPKLFFFDCCRGASMETRRVRRNALDFRVALRCGSDSSDGSSVPSAQADCLAIYATARHFSAFADGEFSQRLCQHIKHFADDGGHDIEDALKSAGADVASMSLGLCRRQAPTYESSLTRRFVLRRAWNSSSNFRWPTALDSIISMFNVASPSSVVMTAESDAASSTAPAHLTSRSFSLSTQSNAVNRLPTYIFGGHHDSRTALCSSIVDRCFSGNQLCLSPPAASAAVSFAGSVETKYGLDEFQSKGCVVMADEMHELPSGVSMWVPAMVSATVRRKRLQFAIRQVGNPTSRRNRLKFVSPIVGLAPGGEHFDDDVLISLPLPQDLHCDGASLRAMLSKGDRWTNSSWISVESVVYWSFTAYVRLRHFCKLGIVRQDLPSDFSYPYRFESWVSSRQQPGGRHALRILIIPVGCQHCYHHASEQRREQLRSEQFLRCCDEAVSLNCKDGDKVELIAMTDTQTICMSFERGVHEVKFVQRVERTTPTHSPTGVRIQPCGSEALGESPQELLFYHPDDLNSLEPHGVIIHSNPEEEDSIPHQATEVAFVEQVFGHSNVEVVFAAAYEQLCARLKDCRPFWLLYTGHCTPAGIALHNCPGSSSRRIVDSEQFCATIGEYLNSNEHRTSSTKLELIVLNSCDSMVVATDLCKLGLTCIAWDYAVKDWVASAFSKQFF